MRVMLKIGDSVILLMKVVLLMYVMSLTGLWQWWRLEGDKGTIENCGGVVKINDEI
jgi:hypothetical protein